MVSSVSDGGPPQAWRRNRPGGISRSRGCEVALAVAVSLAALLASARPAPAQSLLQSIFGFMGSQPGKPQPVVARPQPLPSTLAPAPGTGRPLPLTYNPYVLTPSVPRSAPPAEGRGGSYRTLCVRTCDGFYFPINYGVTRSGLNRDQKACEQSCGASARMYFHPVDGGSVDTMVDLAGQPYKSLPSAFRYRKQLVNGCACKPAPWSKAEAARHESYVKAEAGTEAADDGEADQEAPTADQPGRRRSRAAALSPRSPETAVVLTSVRPTAADGWTTTLDAAPPRRRKTPVRPGPRPLED